MQVSEYILVAVIGGGSALLGAAIAPITECVKFYLQARPQAKVDKARKKLLREMLNDPKFSWRKLDTLKHVIGTDETTTVRLLLELEARGSEDQEPLWGLISRNPFPDRQ